MTASLFIKRCFWFSSSLALSALVIGFAYLFLAQQRAYLALNELKNLQLAEDNSDNKSINAQIRKISYIQSWFKTKNALLSIDDSNWIEATTNIFLQLIKQEPIKALELTSKCNSCAADIFKNLQHTQEKLIEFEKSNKRLEHLKELSSKLNLEIAQKTKLHRILAKDFESLVGSPSAYNDSKSADQILYFISGPFKWLPLLDTSKVDRSLETAGAGNLQLKLESLRQQSKSIIDDYSLLKSKLNQSFEEQAKLQENLENLNKNLSLQLIALWEIYLALFSK